MPMHTKIEEAVQRVGQDKVLYGSDAPFHHPAVEIAKVRRSGLDEELVERVLGRNAVGLFLGHHRLEPSPKEVSEGVGHAPAE
jgi:hypothetical protein